MKTKLQEPYLTPPTDTMRYEDLLETTKAHNIAKVGDFTLIELRRDKRTNSRNWYVSIKHANSPFAQTKYFRSFSRASDWFYNLVGQYAYILGENIENVR